MKTRTSTLVLIYLMLACAVYAQAVDFEEITKTYPRAAIVSIVNEKVTVEKLIQRAGDKVSPSIHLTKGSDFDGTYLVFLPDKKEVNMHEAYVLRIEHSQLVIYEETPLKFPMVENDLKKISKAIVKKRIPIADIEKKLKSYYEKSK